MRYIILSTVLTLCCGAGCTHLALERHTVDQASTTTDLQYQQVLDNIAMFACNSETMPWHLNLQTASVQVTDQAISGAAGARPTSAAPARLAFAWSFLPAFSGQRGVVNQWGGVPTIDSEPLQLLQLAYRKAIDPSDPTLRSEIYQKIAELAVNYNLVLEKKTLDDAIDAIHNPELDEAKKWKLKQKNEEFHERLDKVFKEFAKLSQPPTEIQVDNYAQRLSNKLTEESRGEARAKLQALQAQQSQQLQATRVTIEDQIVRLTRDLAGLPYIPRYPATGRAEHNSQTIAQAQRKVVSLLKLASDEFAQPWVSTEHGHTGAGEGDGDCVPPSAHFGKPYVGTECNRGDSSKCGRDYVGRYYSHGCHCRVHVPADRLGTLRDFTLIVLDLSPIEIQDTTSGGTTGTVSYSPVLAH